MMQEKGGFHLPFLLHLNIPQYYCHHSCHDIDGGNVDGYDERHSRQHHQQHLQLNRRLESFSEYFGLWIDTKIQLMKMYMKVLVVDLTRATTLLLYGNVANATNYTSVNNCNSVAGAFSLSRGARYLGEDYDSHTECLDSQSLQSTA